MTFYAQASRRQAYISSSKEAWACKAVELPAVPARRQGLIFMKRGL